jgi:hypothetical protein
MPQRYDSTGDGSGCFRHDGADVSRSCCSYRAWSSFGMLDRSAVPVEAAAAAALLPLLLPLMTRRAVEGGLGSRGGST